MDYKEFLNKLDIHMDHKQVAMNPNISDMPPYSSHYECLFYRQDENGNRIEMLVPFSMGPALKHDPYAWEVLECVVSDSVGFENTNDIGYWMLEYGYTSLIDARRVYNAVIKQAEALKEFVGEKWYEFLLYEVEQE